jgi:hypothetical protein
VFQKGEDEEPSFIDELFYEKATEATKANVVKVEAEKRRIRDGLLALARAREAKGRWKDGL